MELRISSRYRPNPSRYFQAKTSDPITGTCLKAKGLGEEIHCLVPSQGHWLKENSKMKARLGPPVTPIACDAAAGARPHRAFLLSRSSGGSGCSLGAAGSLLAQPAQVGSGGQSTEGEGCVQLRITSRPLSRPQLPLSSQQVGAHTTRCKPAPPSFPTPHEANTHPLSLHDKGPTKLLLLLQPHPAQNQLYPIRHPHRTSTSFSTDLLPSLRR